MFELFLGTAVEDKVSNSRILKVQEKGTLPFVDGEVDDHDGVESFSLENESGEEENVDITLSNFIPCEYFGGFGLSNRSFPPDVVKGEQVLIIKNADSDLRYWLSLGRDDNYRKNEILRMAVSNRQDLSEDLDDNNTYFIEMDTKFAKRIRIKLNNSDGEDHSYELNIDGKNSKASLSDDIGNKFLLESNVPRIKMQNSSGSLIDLNDKDGLICLPRDLTIMAGRQIVVKAPVFTANIAKSTVWTTPNYGMNASCMSFMGGGGTIELEANLKIHGTLKAKSVKAESYGNSTVGGSYPVSTTDPSTGTGSANSPSPDSSGGEDNRHATAQEQFLEFSKKCTGYFNEINAIIGVPSPDLNGTAIESKMEKLRGE